MASVLDSCDLVNRQMVSNRGSAYVSRSIDLGEDVIAFARLGDRTAQQSLQNLAKIMSAPRFAAVRQYVEQGEVKKGVDAATSSELYYLAQQYLKLRMAGGSSAAELINEPGALGVVAAIYDQSTKNAGDARIALMAEVRQFGSLKSDRSGLARLDLGAQPNGAKKHFRDLLTTADDIA